MSFGSKKSVIFSVLFLFALSCGIKVLAGTPEECRARLNQVFPSYGESHLDKIRVARNRRQIQELVDEAVIALDHVFALLHRKTAVEIRDALDIGLETAKGKAFDYYPPDTGEITSFMAQVSGFADTLLKLVESGVSKDRIHEMITRDVRDSVFETMVNADGKKVRVEKYFIIPKVFLSRLSRAELHFAEYFGIEPEVMALRKPLSAQNTAAQKEVESVKDSSTPIAQPKKMLQPN